MLHVLLLKKIFLIHFIEDWEVSKIWCSLPHTCTAIATTTTIPTKTQKYKCLLKIMKQHNIECERLKLFDLVCWTPQLQGRDWLYFSYFSATKSTKQYKQWQGKTNVLNRIRFLLKSHLEYVSMLLHQSLKIETLTCNTSC